MESTITLVPGEIIPLSPRKQLLVSAFSISLLLLFALPQIWSWWTNTPIPVIDLQMTGPSAIFGAVIMLFCIVGVFFVCWGIFIRRVSCLSRIWKNARFGLA